MQPFWLERQRDLNGPGFVPGVEGRAPENLTHRSWTMLGTVAAVDRGIVDPRGLVTTAVDDVASGWSLDWWIGADDRWHTPSTEAGVRQRLLGDAPVVETVMRIPGGDAVHRAYAVHATGESPFGQAFLVVEIENQSSVPFALALAVLPVNPLGAAPITSIELDGNAVLVDGRCGVLLPKAPARAAAFAGDVAAVVFAGDAPSSFELLRSPDGDGQAALIYPLAHTATLRVVLPLGSPRGERTRPLVRRSSARSVPVPAYPTALPTGEQVAKGWEAQTRRGLQLVLPDAALSTTVEAGRRLLLLAHGGPDLATWPARPLDWIDAAPVLGALDRYGFHDEVEQVLDTIPERQALDGSLVTRAIGEGMTAGANGAALVALGEHWRLSGDEALIDRLVGPIAKAAHWIEKRRSSRRGRAAFTVDDLDWSVRGLRLVADALDAVGQPEVAADARRFADGAAAELGAARGTPARAGRAREMSGAAVVDPIALAGLSPGRTLALASAELEAGDPIALDRLAWVRSVASTTEVWPEVVHPRTGYGSGGDGHHAATGAAFLSFVRDLVVRDTPSGLALCSLWPPDWFGQGIEVHDAPTAFGRLSFALRWHGVRPAVLWELTPHAGRPAAVITAPGIDPSWRTTDARGDALLAAPVIDRGTESGAPPAPAPDSGASFS